MYMCYMTHSSSPIWRVSRGQLNFNNDLVQYSKWDRSFAQLSPRNFAANSPISFPDLRFFITVSSWSHTRPVHPLSLFLFPFPRYRPASYSASFVSPCSYGLTRTNSHALDNT